MFSSTSKTNRQTTSKSNFSLIEDSAQFRSTKVLALFSLTTQRIIDMIIMLNNIYLFQYPNSSIRGVLGIESSSLLQSPSTTLPAIDDNEGTYIIRVVK